MHVGNAVSPLVGMFNQAVQQVQNGGVASETKETRSQEVRESSPTQVREGEASSKSGRLDVFA